MFRSVRNTTLAAIVALAAASTSRIHAAETALALVPESAYGVVYVKSLSALNERIQRVGKKVGAPPVDTLAMARGMTGLGESLDDARDAAVALLPPTDGDWTPTPVVILPVTNYGEFVADLGGEPGPDVTSVIVLGQSYWAADGQGYALLAPANHKSALSGDRPAALAIGATTASWMNEQDVAVYINAAGVQWGMGQAIAGLDKATEFFATNPAINEQQRQQVAAGFAVYGEMFKFMRDEMASLAIGLRVDDGDNLYVAKRVAFKNREPLAEALKELQASTGDPLAGLPAGSFMVAGGGALPKALTQSLFDWSMKLMQANPQAMQMYGSATPEQMAEISQLSLQSMNGVRSMAMLMGPPTEGGMLSGMLGVYRVDDADAFLKQYAATMEKLQQLMADAGGTLKYQTDSIEIAGGPGLSVAMDMSAMFKDQENAEAAAALSRMFGNEGKLTVILAPADNKTVLMTYAGAEAAARQIESMRSGGRGLATMSEVQSVRTLLPEKSPWQGFVSPSGALATVQSIIAAAAPGQGFALPPFPATPAVGCAASLDGDGLSAVLVVPGEVLEAIGEYAGRFRGGAQ